MLRGGGRAGMVNRRVVIELCASCYLKELKSVLIEGRLGREWLVVDMDSLLAWLLTCLGLGL